MRFRREKEADWLMATVKNKEIIAWSSHSVAGADWEEGPVKEGSKYCHSNLKNNILDST